MDDLTKMSLADLGGEMWATESWNEHDAILAELRRRDDAAKRLVAKAKHITDSDDLPTWDDVDALRCALSAFQEPVTKD